MAGIALVCLTLASAAAQPGVDVTPDFRLKKATKLPAHTQMHGSAVVGNRLYVFGGYFETAGWSNQSFSSPVNADGALGPWRRERDMPDRRSYFANSIAAVQDRIYIVGGNVNATATSPESQNQRSKNVAWTRVQADGTLGEWNTSIPFPGQALSCAAACASDRALYLLGGSSEGNIPTQNVSVGIFADDGSLKEWTAGTRLPVPLWFHGVSMQEERLYVWGGLTGTGSDATNKRVFSAPVSEDNSIGSWRDEKSMANGVYSSAFVGANDYLISLGGRYQNGFPTRSIWFAQLKNGVVDEWKLLRSDLEGTVYAAAALDKVRGVVYLTGGRFRLGLDLGSPIVDTVQAFRLEQPAEKRLPSLASLVEKSAPQDAPPTAPAFSSSDPETYPQVGQALATAKGSGKNVLVVFYSPEVPGCRRMRDNVLAKPEFAPLTAGYDLAAADVSGRDSALTYEYTVFRVPAMVVLSPDNKLIKRSGPLATLDELKAFLQKQP